MESHEEFIKLVCDYLHLQVEAVLSKCRKHEYCEARQMISYLLKKHTKMSLRSIADVSLYVSHASVLRDVKQTARFLIIEKTFALKYNDLLIKADQLASKLNKEEIAGQQGYKFEPGDICWFWNDSHSRFPVLGTFERSYLNEDSVQKFITGEFPALDYSHCEYAGERILPENFRNQFKESPPVSFETARMTVSPNHCLV